MRLKNITSVKFVVPSKQVTSIKICLKSALPFLCPSAESDTKLSKFEQEKIIKKRSLFWGQLRGKVHAKIEEHYEEVQQKKQELLEKKNTEKSSHHAQGQGSSSDLQIKANQANSPV